MLLLSFLVSTLVHNFPHLSDTLDVESSQGDLVNPRVSVKRKLQGGAAMLFPAQRFLHRGPSPRVTASLIFLLVAINTPAQKTGGPPTGPTSPVQGNPSPGIGQGIGLALEMNATGIIVRVFNSKGAPLRQQAFVRLYKEGSAAPLRGTLTQGSSQASFDHLPGIGRYTVEVSAAGYRTQRKDFDFTDLTSYHDVDVIMEADSDDPTVTYVSPTALPGKAQKHVDKGVAEFRAGNLKTAEKEFLTAYNAAPKTAETNYLLGLLYLRTKDTQKSGYYFTAALAIDIGNVPVLIGLGRLRYDLGDMKSAIDVLERALALDHKQWEALWVLSEAHLRQHDFEKARSEAQTAVELGKGAANGAEFIEGEALAELGQNAEALAKLQSFLRDAPTDPNAAAARELCARLETEIAPKPDNTAKSDDSLFAADPTPPANSSLAAPPLIPKLQIINWEPLGVDDEKLPVADGVTCPSDQVINEAGKRVTEFVDSVNRIDATEQIIHEELSTLGRPVNVEKRKFDYLISIADAGSGQLVIDESRQGRDAEAGQFLGNVSMFGLADLPLVFHPTMRSDFQMTCEGLGKWQDHATWLVYFRQRPDRPERLRAYSAQNASFTVGIKGRAWISADTYQIVRLEANLMKPIPQIGLGSEEDVVEYGPVPFQTKNTVLWLPSSADIYYYYRHRPFHRHHTFTKYSLFSVSASQKIGQPAIPDEKINQH